MGNFIIGLKVTAIGFTTVFVVLTVLMGIIYVMGSVLGNAGKKPEAAPKAATPAPKAAAPAPAAAKQDDGELIAVIAAAIAACGGSTQAVKSISRVNGTAGAAWTAASRSDAMGSRL